MRLISKGPVKVRAMKKFSNACGCSGIDGSNSSDVRTFQVWANINHAAQLSADGKYGPLTKAAYNKWGAEWEVLQQLKSKKEKPSLSPVDQSLVDNAKVSAEPTPEEFAKKLAENNKPVKLMDKWKALSTTKKGLVIGGGSLLTIGLVILIWKLVIPKK